MSEQKRLDLEVEEFMDILEERRRSSDLGHAFRTFNPQLYRGVPPCSVKDLNRTVLESHYLSYVIKEVCVCPCVRETQNMFSID